MSFTMSLFIAVAVISSLCVYYVLQIGRRDPRMPKGPPTIPVLGNLHQIPVTGLYRKFRDWGQQYGGIFSLKFGPTNAIVLYSREAIHELLDKRGLIYSDRPNSYIGHLMTQGDHVLLSSNDAMVREKRKIVACYFSPAVLDGEAAPQQEAEAIIALNDFLCTPERFYNHIRRVTASTVSILVFGQRGATSDSFWASTVCAVLKTFTEILEPGASPPFDQFPFLKQIP
ncbi:hypothetical protein VTN77DRAFT_7306 [Rasamsonia byssochlamydoides]|uniref:uncharacterized protein n=1 Tax=Rasamsonia byssochlamydoides TaxID=89139 RepID=UPI00374481DC